MFKLSKEIVLFLFVLAAGVGMLFANARTYADPTVPQLTPTNTPIGNYLPLVIKPAGTPTATATATATATSMPSPADIRIDYIEYNPDGSDVDGEYVDLKNWGQTAQDMSGWSLKDESNTTFTFPSFNLQPNSKVRIWTKGGTDTSTDLYWGHNRSIWTNTGDTATLRDDLGQVVGTCSYAGGGSGTSCP